MKAKLSNHEMNELHESFIRCQNLAIKLGNNYCRIQREEGRNSYIVDPMFSFNSCLRYLARENGLDIKKKLILDIPNCELSDEGE